MSISLNLNNLKQKIKSFDVTLVAVSKTKPNEDLMEAYESGQRVFGENKVQELCDKAESLPKDISWHMIGHLQRNKVKYIAPFVGLIHGVDSLKLFKEIEKQAAKIERKVDILLQMHIAEEDSKFGFDEKELNEFLESEAFKDRKYVRIKGLMGMATFTEDEGQIRREFKGLKSLFDKLKSKAELEKDDFSILSMGMSGDYMIALEEGSNMIRVGSAIFGERNYG